MRARRGSLVLAVSVMLLALPGCGDPGPNQAAEDACGDLRKASIDYSDGNIDAATYLGLLGVVAENASKSDDRDLIAAGVVLRTSLAHVDETDTMGDVATVMSRATDMDAACEGLGL